LQMLPVAFALSDRNEIGAKENAGDIGDIEQCARERRACRRFRRREIRNCTLAHDLPAGEEFQRRRIGRGFCLDEHQRTFWNGSKVTPYMDPDLGVIKARKALLKSRKSGRFFPNHHNAWVPAPFDRPALPAVRWFS